MRILGNHTADIFLQISMGLSSSESLDFWLFQRGVIALIRSQSSLNIFFIIILLLQQCQNFLLLPNDPSKLSINPHILILTQSNNFLNLILNLILLMTLNLEAILLIGIVVLEL